MLGGLAHIFVEWTSACDKTHLCGMCGHQNLEINKNLKIGEMSLELMRDIRDQIPLGVSVAAHRDGDPLAFSQVGKALELFRNHVMTLTTHGLNLAKKADEIIDNCTTVNVSIFRGDPDANAQFESLKSFMMKRGNRAPIVQAKIIGDMLNDAVEEYEALGVRVIRRLIHVPISNSKYAHRNPTVPEVGICLDALHRPTISCTGEVFLCNRLDPGKNLYIGSVRESSLSDIWNGELRRKMLDHHKAGRRDLANDLCKSCLHWGTPSA